MSHSDSTASKSTALEYVQALAPYQVGRPLEDLARELGLEPSAIVKLVSNENPLGMSPAAREAVNVLMQGAAVTRYPDSNGFKLKAAISKRFNLPTDHIVLGNGSNDILEIAAAAYLAPGCSCVYAQYAFAVYALATQARGARHIVVAAENFGHDLPTMLSSIAPDTRLLYLANPNNPTGTFLPVQAIDDFLAQVPAHVVVVVDEAYNEYLAPEQRYDSTEWVRRYPNVLISRTFSKAYGLAGLRVGYGMAQPALIELLNRVRQPFNVNALAQVAAVAALEDEAFLAQTYEMNRQGMRQIEDGFVRLGLRFIPSAGNFVLVHVGAAAAVHAALLARGVIVRPVANYGLPEWLRVSIGLPQENERFLTALAEVLQAGG